MKKNILYMVVFFVFIFLESCENKEKIDTVDCTYIVNVDTLKTEDINMSSYFKSVTPIILETNEDCLIEYINDIQVIDSTIFILDGAQQCLLSFNNKGKFIRKIGNKGAGPEEYEYLNDFTINTKEKKIYLFDGYSSKYLVYDINGKYISTIDYDIKLKGNSNQTQYVDGSFYINYVPSNLSSKEDTPLLCKINSITGKGEGCYLSANEDNIGFKLAVTRDFFFRISKNPVYIPTYSNIIYSLTKNGVSPYVTLLSRNIITKNELSNFDMSDLKTLHKLDMSPKIFQIGWYNETANFLFIQFSKGKCFHLVISKTNKDVKMCNFFTDDIIYKKDDNSVRLYPYFSDKNGIYKVIKDYDVPMFIDMVKSGETNLSPEQVDKISKLPEDANPVLFYYECK